MKSLAILLTMLLCAGCSTLSKTTNYEIDASPKFKRTYVYDWCEENQVALGVFGEYCGGVYKPPLYSSPIENGYLVIYPLLVSHNQIAAGPLGLPVIPLGDNEDSEKSEQKLYFRFRTYSESKPFKIAPIKLFVKNAPEERCSISKNLEDDIGSVFTCILTLPKNGDESLQITLQLSNESVLDISYKLSEFTSYRPVIAPNGPARDVKPFIVIEGNDA